MTKILYLRIPPDLYNRIVKATGQDPSIGPHPGRRNGASLNSVCIEALNKAFPEKEEQ